MSVGEVVKSAEELQTKCTKVTEEQYGETIRIGCRSVAAAFDSKPHLCYRESVCIVVQWVLLTDLFDYPSSLWVVTVRDRSSKLVAEMFGY